MSKDPYLKTCLDCGHKWRQSHFDIYCSDCRLSHRLGITNEGSKNESH